MSIHCKITSEVSIPTTLCEARIATRAFRACNACPEHPDTYLSYVRRAEGIEKGASVILPDWKLALYHMRYSAGVPV
jgi:hypothetical protein